VIAWSRDHYKRKKASLDATGFPGASIRPRFAALQSGLPATGLWSLLMEWPMRAPADASQRSCAGSGKAIALSSHLMSIKRTQHDLDAHLLRSPKISKRWNFRLSHRLAPVPLWRPPVKTALFSTMRGTEVLSDPTNVLALESACRLQQDPTLAAVRLATSPSLRPCAGFADRSGFRRSLSLVSASRQRAMKPRITLSWSGAFTEHLRFHLDALARLNEHGYRFERQRVKVLTTSERAHLIPRIVANFRRRGA